MFQRKSTNNISPSGSTAKKSSNKPSSQIPINLPNSYASKKLSTKSSIAISSSSKKNSFTSRLTPPSPSLSHISNPSITVQGIFRQRTNLSIPSIDSTIPIEFCRPLRKRSRSNIERNSVDSMVDSNNSSRKPLRSKTAILTPKSTRLTEISVNKTAAAAAAEQNRSTTKQYDEKLMASKRNLEKRSLETQLITKRKHFNFEKGRLLNAQTQVLNMCKTIEELQMKLNQLSSSSASADSSNTITNKSPEPIEKLKLVAYNPDVNHFYMCKDSAVTFAANAEKQRIATIDHFRQSIVSIGDEMQHQHNTGFDMCNNMIQEMYKCFVDLKKGRPFELDLYVKKMQMTLKDIENVMLQQRQNEYDHLHLFLRKCEKSILSEKISIEDRKKLSSAAAAAEFTADGDHHVVGDRKSSIDDDIDDSNMNEKLKALQLNVDAKTKEIDKLQCDLNEAKNIIEQNQFTTNKDDTITAELKMELDDIKHTLRQANEQIIENDAIIAELNKTNKELRQNIDQNNDKSDKLTSDSINSTNTNSLNINHLNEKYLKAKLQLKEQYQTIIMYQRLMRVRSELINSMQVKESFANCQVKDLRSEIDTNNMLFDRMKCELMEKGDELKQLNDILMKKDQDIVQLRNANNKLRKQFQEIMGFSKL